MDKYRLQYQKAKFHAKQFYSRIKSISCPVLDGESVFFRKSGFNHLVRKGQILRPLSDQIKRFSLLPLVQAILLDPKAMVVYLRKESDGMRPASEFWTFVKNLGNGTKIKVVVRQKGDGSSKHFFSVMSGKQKAP